MFLPLPFSLQSKLFAQPPMYVFTSLWCFRYSFWASTLHSLTIWYIVSLCAPHILHNGDFQLLSIKCLMWFALRVCSWALHINASVHPFLPAHFNHFHELMVSFPFNSLTNCWYIHLSFQLLKTLSFSLFLYSSGFKTLSVIIVSCVLTATKSDSTWCLMYQPRLISSVLIHPLQL